VLNYFIGQFDLHKSPSSVGIEIIILAMANASRRVDTYDVARKMRRGSIVFFIGLWRESRASIYRSG
jgi:hypothetical protein